MPKHFTMLRSTLLVNSLVEQQTICGWCGGAILRADMTVGGTVQPIYIRRGARRSDFKHNQYPNFRNKSTHPRKKKEKKQKITHKPVQEINCNQKKETRLEASQKGHATRRPADLFKRSAASRAVGSGKFSDWASFSITAIQVVLQKIPATRPMLQFIFLQNDLCCKRFCNTIVVAMVRMVLDAV